MMIFNKMFNKTNSKMGTPWIFIVAALCSQVALSAPVTLLKDDMTYVVNEDGTYSYEESESIQINDVQGVAQRSQAPLPYSESLQTLEVIEAYTVTKDGQRIDVAPDKIMTQQLPASTNAPMYSDYKLKIVVFPQVEVGAVLNLHFKRTQLKPELPGVFSMHEIFNKTIDIKNSHLILRVPASMTLQIDAVDVQGGEIRPTSSGLREWQWSIADAAATPGEAGSVDMADVSPHVVATNLKSYDDLAKAYLVGALPAAKVTAPIQSKADEITRSISDKRAQAEAIYQWVSKNIRYVGIFLNVGGYVPHDATAVLQALYGDCKDHATLLQALLAAKGIKSAQVLINLGNSYSLPNVASLRTFNHAINYLPDYQLFVDSTIGFASFGVLADTASGKSALVVDTGKGKPGLMTTPLISDKNDQIEVHTTANIANDGAMTGKNSVQSTGVFEMVHRALLGSMPKQQLPQIASTLLSRIGQSGSGNFVFGDARDVSLPFGYEFEFQLPNRIALPGPGAFAAIGGIGSPLGIDGFVKSYSLAERKFNFQCAGGSREEVIQIMLPDTLKVGSMPKAVSAKSKFGNYESSYALNGQQLTVTRKLNLQFPKAVCSPADYMELKSMANTISQDLRAQILYQ